MKTNKKPFFRRKSLNKKNSNKIRRTGTAFLSVVALAIVATYFIWQQGPTDEFQGDVLKFPNTAEQNLTYSICEKSLVEIPLEINKIDSAQVVLINTTLKNDRIRFVEMLNDRLWEEVDREINKETGQISFGLRPRFFMHEKNVGTLYLQVQGEGVLKIDLSVKSGDKIYLIRKIVKFSKGSDCDK